MSRIHKSPKNITAKYFKDAVGYPHEHDDLERCNCKCKGLLGHSTCGWNRHINLPNFQSSSTEFMIRAEDKTGVDTCLLVV